MENYDDYDWLVKWTQSQRENLIDVFMDSYLEQIGCKNNMYIIERLTDEIKNGEWDFVFNTVAKFTVKYIEPKKIYPISFDEETA